MEVKELEEVEGVGKVEKQNGTKTPVYIKYQYLR